MNLEFARLHLIKLMKPSAQKLGQKFMDKNATVIKNCDKEKVSMLRKLFVSLKIIFFINCDWKYFWNASDCDIGNI